MPRPSKQRLTFDLDSLQKHLQEVYNQLEELRIKANKDYNRVIAMMKTATDIVAFENTRNNALKTFENFHAKKMELLKIHKDITLNVAKAASAAGDEKTPLLNDEEMQIKMQKMMQELRDASLDKK